MHIHFMLMHMIPVDQGKGISAEAVLRFRQIQTSARCGEISTYMAANLNVDISPRR